MPAISSNGYIEAPTVSSPKLQFEGANWFSRLFFVWLFPLLRLGYKANIELENLFHLPDEQSVEVLHARIIKNWDIEVKRKNPSLFRALRKTFFVDFMSHAIFLVMQEGCVLCQPVLLKFLLQSFEDFKDPVNFRSAWIYASMLAVITVITPIVRHPYFYKSVIVGIRFRVGCSALVYNKILRLNQSALINTTTGQIINLLTNDVHRFDSSFIFLHYLWLSPFLIIIVLFFLWWMIGIASLAGIGVLICLTPLQFIIGHIYGKIRHRIAAFTDERVKLVSEIINGIRIVKMYCWENMFLHYVGGVRRNECQKVAQLFMCHSVSYCQVLYQQKLALLGTLLVMIYNDIPITSSAVFTIFLFFSNLRVIVSLFLPNSIVNLSDMLVTFQRLQTFLLLPELGNEAIENTVSPGKDDAKANEPSIEFVKFTTTWNPKEQSKVTLDAIDVNIKGSKLVVIAGPVGSGKSSLLMALLKELPPSSGSVSCNGSIAYASQQPWVFAATIRDNIIFGKEMDPDYYDLVIKATTLYKDFSLLKHGDLTLVGERGVSLSGGQRARIGLARAVYARADIYLLDDPLSAVDTHVGRVIFEECLKNLLADKLVILVTHQLQYLKNADEIIIMNAGQVENAGTYDTLVKHGLDFDHVLECNEPKKSRNDSSGASKTELCIPHSLSASTDHLNIGQPGMYASMESLTELEPPSATIPDTIEEEDECPEEQKESSNTGAISFKIYFSYLHAAGSWIFSVLVLMLYIVTLLFYVSTDAWLSYWTKMERTNMDNLLNFTSLNATNSTAVPPIHIDSFYYFSIYAYLCLGLVLIAFIRAVSFFSMSVCASRRLHKKMLKRLLFAPVRFFDVNPAGRILNRYSKDVGVMDDLLPITNGDFLQCLFIVISIVLVAFVSNWFVIIPSIPIVVIFYYIKCFYMASSTQVKRLEATSRSPVFAHVTNTLHGLTTIRAWNIQHRFKTEYSAFQNVQTNCSFHFVSLARWFGIYLDLTCSLFITIVIFSILVAAMYSDISSGIVGLSISYSLGLLGLFQWCIRQHTEVENQLVSVERIMEYTRLPQEPAYESEPGSMPPATWPDKGHIEFKGVHLRYFPEGPLVLNSINFAVRSGEKLGIVGRTGAGKSSLIAALFRLAHIEGKLTIDGIDISSLGLKDLRQKISIIPQDPVLFTGTVRLNLDPFNEASDDRIWNALEEVQMKEAIQSLSKGLESDISEGGSNLSVGERQLICLARALLRHNRILLVDEATANVDHKTDALIQRTIRQKFHSHTVLTIAHRLHTVMDSDRIMVMEAGQCVEIDTPLTLLSDTSSYLYHLVEQTSASDRRLLHRLAKENHNNANMTTKPDVSSNGHASHPPSFRSPDDVQFVQDLDITPNGITDKTPML